ncbi:MAG: hypothetical protein ACRDPF_20840 [Streptosporangiaceae bacterium]
MRRPRRIPAKESVIAAASLCVVAALPGCSAAGSASSPAADPPVPTTVHSTAHPARPALAFTVTGNRPVLRSGSQDTHAQTPNARCDSATFAADKDLGARVARAFGLAGFPASADLLAHFLTGKGTEVNYRAGSPIAKKALASEAFRALNAEVQKAILGQLKAGRTRVRLSAAQLPAVAFESRSSDLYWGFRGTQGLTVTGRGTRENGRYVGTLSYVIRDSYGFPVGDTLEGFGPPMRYLQTVCGAPRHAGGARWFPDTITVTVPFNRPA